MSNESRPSDRLVALEADHRRVSASLQQLDEVIRVLGGSASLRPDEAARLEMYRHNQQRKLWERKRLELEIEELSRALDGYGEVRISVLSQEMLKRVQDEKRKAVKDGWPRS